MLCLQMRLCRLQVILGTMISIQAVANLPKQISLSKIDKVVLFQGPDARESINKMSQQAQENLQQLEEQGKIDYYECV